MEATMLLLGATGAVGRQVLEQALASDTYTQVIALTRRPIEGYQDHPGLVQHIVDFEQLEQYRHLMKARDVVNALGSTIKKAGSKERFFRIDHDYPLTVAQFARENGAQRMILVSSLGADANSWTSNYLRVKGQLEDDLRALQFPSYVILQPSLLLGEREEDRPGEEFGKRLEKLFRPLIPKRYRGIHVATIAQRIIQIGQTQPTGEQIYLSEQIPVGS